MAEQMLVAGGLDPSGNAKPFKVDASGNLTVGGSTTAPGTASIATGQVTVATTATVVAAARTGRRSITIVNEGTTDVRIGAAGVTAGNGLLLSGVKGQTLTVETAAAVYGIVGTGTQAVSYVEAY